MTIEQPELGRFGKEAIKLTIREKRVATRLRLGNPNNYIKDWELHLPDPIEAARRNIRLTNGLLANTPEIQEALRLREAIEKKTPAVKLASDGLIGNVLGYVKIGITGEGLEVEVLGEKMVWGGAGVSTWVPLTEGNIGSVYDSNRRLVEKFAKAGPRGIVQKILSKT